MKRLMLNGMIPVNCYLIENGTDCYIVDPGFDKEKIKNWVDSLNLNVKGILLTHAHFDHIDAADCYPVPVYLHKDEVSVLRSPKLNGLSEFNSSLSFDIESLELKELSNGDKLPLGDDVIEVIHTPGHTSGCVCYKYKDELYSGDTLFHCSVGRWDFPTGDQSTLKDSVVTLIESLPLSTKVYPGHDEITTIKEEREFNDFYLHWKAGGFF